MPSFNPQAESKYRAPALEKGLDVLELLASAKRPLTLSQISKQLGRSVSEMFRTVHVLQMRNFICVSSRGDGFELAGKVFSLAISYEMHRGGSTDEVKQG